MRLALLGLDETTIALASAARHNDRDEFVLFCDLQETAELENTLRSAPIHSQSWEALLGGGPGGTAAFDAVLVSRDAADDERRLEQLRKLVQAGVPMLVSHPVHPSMLAYYELDMIRRDTGCVMLPVLPARRNPLAKRMKELIEQSQHSTLGQVDQILFERSIPKANKETVVAQFAQDVDLLSFLGGDVCQLGAMGLPTAVQAESDISYRNLGVQMTTSHGRLLRWSVDPASEPSASRVLVSGHNGKATLFIPARQSKTSAEPLIWQLEVSTGAPSAAVETVEWSAYVQSLDELREVLSRPDSLSRWPDAARSVELAETIDRSLAKRRTIDLHDQEFSDAATFKGLMTGLGCLLLLLAVGLTVVSALLANFLKHAGALGAAQVVGSLPYLFLGLFALFLAAQFLLKLVQPPRDKRAR